MIPVMFLVCNTCIEVSVLLQLCQTIPDIQGCKQAVLAKGMCGGGDANGGDYDGAGRCCC
jgi:hypothetical protein